MKNFYKWIDRKDEEFKTNLIARMKTDCDYYLGNGNRCAKHLWALDEKTHIAYMRYIWGVLKEKPRWLSMQDIANYYNKMTEKGE